MEKKPDIEILIEGHTDNVPIKGGAMKDNWDLSVSRATAVVRKLIDMGVNPEQLIASGRSKYMPVAENDSRDGRNSNRRTEAILVPNIGKLYRVYKNQQ